MTGLLVLTGLLLLVSGGVKLRSGRRARLGAQPLTLLELLAAGVLCVGAAGGLGSAPISVVLVPVCTILVLVSSMHFWTRLSAHRTRRELTEARRLETYVKYLAGAEDADRDDS